MEVNIGFLFSKRLNLYLVKYYKTIIVFVFLLIFQLHPNVLFAQFTTNRLMKDFRTLELRDAVRGLTYEDIEGSPYYTDLFVNGTVYLRDSGIFTPIALRYDLFQDEVEFKQDGTIYYLLKNNVSAVKYGTDTLIPDILAENPAKVFYFFVREKGRYALYIRKIVTFSPYEPAQAYANPKPNRFDVAKNVFYLKKEDSPPVLIDSKRDLLSILEDNKPALEYLKKSRTKINEEGLTALVRFLNHH